MKIRKSRFYINAKGYWYSHRFKKWVPSSEVEGQDAYFEPTQTNVRNLKQAFKMLMKAPENATLGADYKGSYFKTMQRSQYIKWSEMWTIKQQGNRK